MDVDMAAMREVAGRVSAFGEGLDSEPLGGAVTAARAALPGDSAIISALDGYVNATRAAIDTLGTELAAWGRDTADSASDYAEVEGWAGSQVRQLGMGLGTGPGRRPV